VVVDSKYGNELGEWCSNEAHGAHLVGFWKIIRRGLGGVSSHTRFEVGDGSKIRLWYDVWCADQALKVTFLDLFSLAHCKDAVVADLLEFF
jgi:hypothetical protein